MASPPARLPDSPLGEPGTHVDHLASRTRRASVILLSQATGKNETHRDPSKGLPYVGRKRGLVSSLFWRAADSFALFYTTPILSGLSLPFARLFCLQHYLQEPVGAWLGVVARTDCTEARSRKRNFGSLAVGKGSRRVIAVDVCSLDLACNRLRIGR
jgi:hypothetical protein